MSFAAPSLPLVSEPNGHEAQATRRTPQMLQRQVAILADKLDAAEGTACELRLWLELYVSAQTLCRVRQGRSVRGKLPLFDHLIRFCPLQAPAPAARV